MPHGRGLNEDTMGRRRRRKKRREGRLGVPKKGEASGASTGRGGLMGGVLRRGLAVGLLLVVVLGLGIAAETRTSWLQSKVFTKLVADVGWELREGPSSRIRYPDTGPADERLGYTTIPRRVEKLQASGFRVTEQAVVSDRFADLVDRGLYPVFREKQQGGLHLVDRRGSTFFVSPHPQRIYTSLDSVPEILWRSLLYIENRKLLDPERPRRNPAVEWKRLARSVTDLGLRMVGSDRPVPGGSTLATQLEKFRHSPGGRTTSAEEKLRQMVTASARAYLDGPETLEAQRRVLLDYLNAVPLAAQRNHGEVLGTADGLWAWYGTDFDSANHLLRGEDLTPVEDSARARVVRQAVSLLVAHRRPSWYLAREEGREELSTLTDQYLRVLREGGVLTPALTEAALAVRTTPLSRAPDRPPVSFIEQKAANQVRSQLLGLMDVPQLYELDRYDMGVATTLDMTWTEGVSALFRQLQDTSFVRSGPFGADRLLARGDPAGVLYSLTLLETTPLGNVVRVQVDNHDGPLSLTQGSRLELGSTAKLRTLVTYLEVVAELHERLSGLPTDSLRSRAVPERDRLSRWAVDHLVRNPETSLEAMLAAAMERRYSASPSERFATGGGVQSFSNFDRTYDASVMSVTEAFRFSVNLPWIRIMRDVVSYFMYRDDGSTARTLEDPEVRQEYLARFADREGSQFVGQFHRKYRDLPDSEILDGLVRDRALGPQRAAWAFRTVMPDASLEQLSLFLDEHTPYSDLSDEAVADLYRRTDPAPHDLSDLGFLARIHPLELWVAAHHLDHPGATLIEVLEASRDVRQEVYRWLFRTRIRNAQDQRIRTMLEIEAFEEIHRSWRRVGYPFANIVPSLGTAIGSSGDHPLALAELVGIVRNDGIRYPTVRVAAVRMAEGTPYETALARERVEGERVMRPEVAAAVRDAMVDVVESGTARRVQGAVTDREGSPVQIGAKTGTGDNRFRVFGAGGQVVESRIVNRTATLVFFLGERHFGVVTSYVPGPAAAGYDFTSGLPSQVLRSLGSLLSPLDVVGADAN